jgi:hypothetical protein
LALKHCQRKPVGGSQNPQYLPLILPLSLHLFFSPLRRSARSTPTFKSFFILKTVFPIAKAFGNFHIFPFCVELSVMIRQQSLHNGSGSARHRRYVYTIAKSAA